MKGQYCPRVGVECPNGTRLEEPALNTSLRMAYEDGIPLERLAQVLKRHKCTIRASIISAGGSIRTGGPYLRRPL